jgi:signal transduction histidine kinase
VQAHGGDIDVASRSGAGTRITVSLPRKGVSESRGLAVAQRSA